MKTIRTIAAGICFLLTACTALLPQAAAPEEAEGPPPDSEVVVEQVVEVVNVGSEPAEGDIGPTTVEIVGGDEAALREFVERWLGSTYPGQPADHITVYLGSLPPDLPYTLPLPEGARVIGSMEQTSFDQLQVILDTSLSPEDVLAFYVNSLVEMGWEAASDAGYGGGFVPSDLGLNYCLGDDTAFNIYATPGLTGATDVRIYISVDESYSQCNADEWYGQDLMSTLIPALKSPPEVQTISSGGGSSGDSEASTESIFSTELTAGELAAHYNEQLVAAGWTLLESGEAEGHGWSYWSLTDDEGREWFGTLVLLEVPPGSDTIFAYIRVER